MAGAIRAGLLLIPALAAGGATMAAAAGPRAATPAGSRTEPPEVAAPDAADLLRARLVADHALAAAPPATERPAATVRALIAERIDPRLLDGALAVRGRDYRFAPADGSGRHVGLVTIRYATAAIAGTRAAALGGERYFRNAKILTPMIVAARGDTVAILHTESAGDRRLRATLAEVARDFRGD